MAEVKKVTVEEFDEEGNLVKRTTTEYSDKGCAIGGTWHAHDHFGTYESGTYVVEDPNKYVSYNIDHTQYVKIGDDLVRKDRL